MTRMTYGEWYTWFAWRPVFLRGEGVVWLRWIERRDVMDWHLWKQYRDYRPVTSAAPAGPMGR